MMSTTTSVPGGLTSAVLQKYFVSYSSFMVTTPRTFSFSTSCNATKNNFIYFRIFNDEAISLLL